VRELIDADRQRQAAWRQRFEAHMKGQNPTRVPMVSELGTETRPIPEADLVSETSEFSLVLSTPRETVSQQEVPRDKYLLYLPGCTPYPQTRECDSPSDPTVVVCPESPIEDRARVFNFTELIPVGQNPNTRPQGEGYMSGRVLRNVTLWEFEGVLMGPRAYLQKVGAHPPVWDGQDANWDLYWRQYACWEQGLFEARQQLEKENGWS
jgi:hypothetical protein